MNCPMLLRTLVLPLLLTTLAIAATTGCKPSQPPLVVDGYTLNPDPWNQDRQTIVQRASFDLNCDPQSLEVRVLAAGGGQVFDDWATQVGVSGCGQRGVYVRTQSGWVLNVARTDAK